MVATTRPDEARMQDHTTKGPPFYHSSLDMIFIYVITCGEQYSFPLAFGKFGSRLRGDFRVHIFLEIGLTAKREEEGGKKEG